MSTQLVYDTFTGSTVKVQDHIGEVGATWTQSDQGFSSSTTGNEFRVGGGVLRRYTFAESGSGWGNDAYITPSGAATLPTTDFYFEIKYIVQGLTGTWGPNY